MAKFVRGQSGNPAGSSRRVREKLKVFNLGAEARKFADVALETLVAVCKGEIKQVTPRYRVAAANALLDRGFGRPSQQVDLVLLSKRLTELSHDELVELNSRLTPSAAIGAADAVEPPLAEEQLH